MSTWSIASSTNRIIEFTPDEQLLLGEILEGAYRQAHREAWEVEHSGDSKYLAEVRDRLDAIEGLLRKCGSNSDVALRPIKGGDPE